MKKLIKLASILDWVCMLVFWALILLFLNWLLTPTTSAEEDFNLFAALGLAWFAWWRLVRKVHPPEE